MDCLQVLSHCGNSVAFCMSLSMQTLLKADSYKEVLQNDSRNPSFWNSQISNVPEWSQQPCCNFFPIFLKKLTMNFLSLQDQL